MIQIFVPGDPKPQPRPRAFARKIGGKAVARVYDAGTAEGWKSRIAEALKPWVGRWRADGRVGVEMQFVFRRPSSHWRKRGGLTKSAPLDHVSRPDLDNLVKAVLDCCTTLGLWADDGQVGGLLAEKRYQNDPADPSGVELTLDVGGRAMLAIELFPVAEYLDIPDLPDEEETDRC